MDAGLHAGVMPPMSLGGMDRKNRLAGRDNLSNTLPLIPGDRAAFRPKMLKAPPRIDDILILCTFFLRPRLRSPALKVRLFVAYTMGSTSRPDP